jgi:hypothetical protein
MLKKIEFFDSKLDKIGENVIVFPTQFFYQSCLYDIPLFRLKPTFIQTNKKFQNKNKIQF